MPASAEPDPVLDGILRLVAGVATGAEPLSVRTRVVMLAGGTDPTLGAPQCADVIEAALGDIEATLVAGGTVDGVAGIAGAVSGAPGIRTVGYLPEGRRSEADPRYDEIRCTAGDDYSVLEPVTAWADVLASGVRATDVVVLGVGGGPIAAAEYRLGLALGARVGVVEGSGRAADALLADPAWGAHQRLTALSPTAAAVRQFILV